MNARCHIDDLAFNSYIEDEPPGETTLRVVDVLPDAPASGNINTIQYFSYDQTVPLEPAVQIVFV